MKDKIVPTQNLSGFIALVTSLINKPERMDRMGIICGKWGLGKSTAVQWYFANNPCIYVRAMSAWTRSVVMMLEDILRGYRVKPRGRFKSDIRELVRVAKKSRTPLFIDEANRVVRKSLLIETIRDLHDLARIPIILIGQEDILNLLKRHDLMPVFSRVTEVFEFKELSATDIQRVAVELCDLQCDLNVAALIRTICLGDFRLVNALLIKAEEICEFNRIGELTTAVVKDAASTMPDPENIEAAVRAARGTPAKIGEAA